MSDFQMPEGQYFSLSGMVRANTGGQTGALLMRNRLLARRAGIEPIILTFDNTPCYPETRKALSEQGLLVDPMRLLNIFEWYREHSVEHLEPIGGALPEVENNGAVDQAHPDGTVYRTQYGNSETGQPAIQDYRRPDGSVYARVRNQGHELTPVTLVNSKGLPVARWPSVDGWNQHWIRELTPPAARAFIISDSRYALVKVLALSDDQFHIIHQMHNIHVGRPRHWHSPIKVTYLPLMASISQLDGLVTLTGRQRTDITQRFGETNNVYVVPNPVESPPHPNPLPTRATKRFVIVSRFVPQKALEHAIRVFALVLKEEPDATLDVYGDGRTRDRIEAEIEQLGVDKSVKLHGFDPRARETMWTATGFLMTSKFEGYPLATLEALSHGCPVISYDIKYGPREQITHGVDGFLVNWGQIQEMADRVVELIRDPELVARMSAAGFEKAARHDATAYLQDWRTVLEAVVAAKERRTVLESVSLTVTRLGYRRLLPRFPGDAPLGRGRRSEGAEDWRGHGKITFRASLDVTGHSRRSSLDSALVSLEAIDHSSSVIQSVPMTVSRSESTFELAATIDVASVFRGMGVGTRSMRLRFAWENSSWETTITPPAR